MDNKLVKFFFFIFAFLLGLIFPITLIPLMILMLYGGIKGVNYIFALFIAFLFAHYQPPETFDLYRQYQYFESVKSAEHYYELYQGYFGLFYIAKFFQSLSLPGNVLPMVTAFCLIILPLKTSEKVFLSTSKHYLLFSISLLMCFPMLGLVSTIRSGLATFFFILFVLSFFERKKGQSFVLLLCSFSVHYSFIVPFLIFLSSFLLVNRVNDRRFLQLVFIVVLSVGLLKTDVENLLFTIVSYIGLEELTGFNIITYISGEHSELNVEASVALMLYDLLQKSIFILIAYIYISYYKVYDGLSKFIVVLTLYAIFVIDFPTLARVINIVLFFIIYDVSKRVRLKGYYSYLDVVLLCGVLMKGAMYLKLHQAQNIKILTDSLFQTSLVWIF
ncbi:EpsG family protein [Vibrio owensii]|uniref:EpsG family protein n=1 Tax=Vibrio owensii TaxID=696485 RepID=UPI0005EE46CA|nr:EpsG family protein [Vibrio owensii]